MTGRAVVAQARLADAALAIAVTLDDVAEDDNGLDQRTARQVGAALTGALVALETAQDFLTAAQVVVEP